MWNPVTGGPSRTSYGISPTDEDDSHDIRSDDTLLAKGRPSAEEEDDEEDENGLHEHDMPLTSEELAFDDPMDEKSSALYQLHRRIEDAVPARIRHALPQWARFKPRLRWWKRRPKGRFGRGADDEEVDEKEPAGLLNMNWSSGDRLLAAGHQTVSWLIWPLPSYLHPFFLNQRPKPEPKRSTDYLDGIRGYASLFVFFDHYLVGLKTDIVDYSFGADDNFYNAWQLPFIRTIYSGSAMVAIFFVISGYVLSARCVVAMRAGNQEKMHSALTSMTFRRALRLFVPSIAAGLVTLIAVFLGIVMPEHPHHWTVLKELHSYWRYLHEDLFKLWAWDISFKGWYSPQLWTIPLEFKCSMILFMLILGTARCTVYVRFSLEAFLILYLFYVGRWDVALFFSGMAIAEMNIIHDERAKAREEARVARFAAAAGTSLDTITDIPPPKRRHPLLTLLIQLPLWLVLLFGWYLTGYPGSDADHTPGYRHLTHFWHQDWAYKFRFWIAIGAILVIFATSFLKPAQRFFTTGFARYLGKISYALYLVHVIMNRTLRYFLWNTFWGILRYESAEGDDAKFEGGWFLGTIIYVPCVLWAADIFWRLVDVPSVRLAKWVEERCFVR